MKNPNGYGTVVKLSGNRRKPYAVRKTKGFNEKGHPIYICIGYTATREEGMIMLAEYNHNPYDVDLHNITVKEVYEKWSDSDFLKMSQASQRSLKTAWNHCEAVQSMKYIDLNAYLMQECIDKCDLSYSSKGAIKTLFSHLDKFASKLNIIVKLNSQLITAPPIPETTKEPFTEDEIKAVWKIKNQDWVDTVLCFLYMGWRISELLDLRTENVDLKAGTITGGKKTKNGKNRVVPIHPKILPFIKKHYNPDNEYLFTLDNHHMSVATYYNYWNDIMEQLKMEHTPHECRHTFRSRLDSKGANKKCIDLLMGHKSKDVGERVYTHKTIDELKEAINLLD